MHDVVKFFSGFFMQLVTIGVFGGLLAVTFAYASQAESRKRRLAMVPMVGMILAVSILGLKFCSRVILEQIH